MARTAENLASRDWGAFFSAGVGEADPEVAGAIGREVGRQRFEIELIASENIVSRAVLEAAGSPLTNKYAEGYPGLAGCARLNSMKPTLVSSHPITATATPSVARGANSPALVAFHGMNTARSARSTPYEIFDSVDLFIAATAQRATALCFHSQQAARGVS